MALPPPINLETAKRFASAVPHMSELGMEITEAAPFEGVMRLPFRDDLVGNPDTGVLHGGVITTLIDSIAGFAVFASLDEMRPIATLDLRIDYLKPAPAGEDLFAYAHCYKVTRTIAFVRAVAYHRDRDDPIANTVATFMLGTPGDFGVSSSQGDGKGPAT